MNNRLLTYIIIGFFGFVILAAIVGILIQPKSLPELKPNLISDNSGIVSVVNNQPYLVNNTKLYKITDDKVILQKEFSNDSQININPFGNYVVEKRPNNITVYKLDGFQSVQQFTGRFFSWLSKDNYIVTSSTDLTEGTDAGELTETAYRGTIIDNQKEMLFTGQFITYMLLSDNTYIDLAQRDNQDNFDSININQFTKQGGLQKITNKKNFGYKPFLTLGMSLIQENIEGSSVYVLKNKQLTKLNLTHKIQAITATNENTLLYFDTNKDQKNEIDLYTYNITNQTTKAEAKLPVNLGEIGSIAINSQSLFINTGRGLYSINIEGIK